LRVPKVSRRSTLSLLSLSRPSTLRLSTRALCEPRRASAIEPARLRRCASSTLRATRSPRADTDADVLRARTTTLYVRLERRLWRRGRSARAETLLVLVRVQRLAVVRAGEDTNATEAAAQLVRVTVRVRVVA